MKISKFVNSSRVIYKIHPEYLNYMKGFLKGISDVSDFAPYVSRNKTDQTRAKLCPTPVESVQNACKFSHLYNLDQGIDYNSYLNKLQSGSLGGSIKEFLDFQEQEQHKSKCASKEELDASGLNIELLTNTLKHPVHDLMDSYMRFRMGHNFISLGHVLLERAKTFPDQILFKQVSSNGNIPLSISAYESFYLVEKLRRFFDSLPTDNKYIGIYLNNCPEWYISMLSITNSKKTVVPLHLNYGTKELSYILSIAKLETIVTSSSCVNRLIKKLDETKINRELIKLKNVILTDSDIKTANTLNDLGIKVFSLDDVFFGDFCSFADSPVKINLAEKIKILKESKKFDFDIDLNKAEVKSSLEDVACILFTSGTTGIPKGVVLKHKNYLSQIANVAFGAKNLGYFDFVEGDTTLSYLPAAHVLEQLNTFLALSINMEIAFTRENKIHFANDLKILQPSFLPAVPAVLKNIVDGIEKKAADASVIKKLFLDAAVTIKADNVNRGITEAPLWVKMILGKVQKELGGRIRNVLSGGTAASKDLLQKVEILTGAKVRQGYGLTETLAGTTLDDLSSNDLSSVGHPFGGSILKLVPLDDDPNLYYLHVKGPSVTDGYFMPDKEIVDQISNIPDYKGVLSILAENPFDEEGFFNTNDVVKINSNGKISIVARNKKSDLVKLPNGEFISYEAIENSFAEKISFGEMFAVLKPNSFALQLIFFINKDQEIKDEKFAESVEKVLSLLKSQNKINKNLKIDQISIIKNFTKEGLDDFFTPTLKKKRQEFEKIMNAITNDPSISEMDKLLKKINR